MGGPTQPDLTPMQTYAQQTTAAVASGLKKGQDARAAWSQEQRDLYDSYQKAGLDQKYLDLIGQVKGGEVGTLSDYFFGIQYGGLSYTPEEIMKGIGSPQGQENAADKARRWQLQADQQNLSPEDYATKYPKATNVAPGVRAAVDAQTKSNIERDALLAKEAFARRMQGKSSYTGTYRNLSRHSSFNDPTVIEPGTPTQQPSWILDQTPTPQVPGQPPGFLRRWVRTKKGGG